MIASRLASGVDDGGRSLSLSCKDDKLTPCALCSDDCKETKMDMVGWANGARRA